MSALCVVLLLVGSFGWGLAWAATRHAIKSRDELWASLRREKQALHDMQQAHDVLRADHETFWAEVRNAVARQRGDS